MAKHSELNINRKQNKGFRDYAAIYQKRKPLPLNDVEPLDYTETPECAELLAQIVAVLIEAGGPVTSGYINRRVVVPAKWSLMDVIGTSKHVYRGYRHPFHTYEYTEVEQTLAPAAEFGIAPSRHGKPGWNNQLFPDLGL